MLTKAKTLEKLYYMKIEYRANKTKTLMRLTTIWEESKVFDYQEVSPLLGKDLDRGKRLF